MRNSEKLKLGLLSATIFTSAVAATVAHAQDTAPAEAISLGDNIVVTATRRATTLMDTPINITAIGADDIAKNRIDDIRDLADFTPGITVADTGPGSTGAIILRGLRASDTTGGGTNFDNALGVYLGEVPLFFDFKTNDVERIETLLGPQGTLYGLGTLAGAIRYIPNRPDPTRFEGAANGRVYAKSHSDDIGVQFDGVINIPIVRDHIAFRSSTGYYFDPGFIDYPLLLQEPGISLPQPDGPDFVSPEGFAANLFALEDLNFEKTFTTRNQLLFQTTEDFKLFLTYAYQQTETDGSQTNSDGVFGTGRFENASRFIEPVDRSAHLVAAEVNANVADIFDIVATAAYTQVDTLTNGDVTDLLLDLDYDYELEPTFAGFNEGDTRRKQKNVEIRLVSRHDGPLSWVVGGFYNENDFVSDGFESLPNFPGVDTTTNPDFIEFISFIESEVVERAVFGEVTYEVTPEWQVTVGGRYFDYTSEIAGAQSLPLLGQPVDPRTRPINGGEAEDNGVVWKFNTSYQFTPDLLVYGTYSQGYRIGGPNRVAPCPDPLPMDGAQLLCALPNEIDFAPDTTNNIEVGVRSQLFDNRLRLNFNVFHIEWDGIQLDSATLNGIIGITVNGGSARSKGFEMSFQANPTPELSIQGTYSYLDAALTQDVPNLLSINDPPGVFPSEPINIDALSGDRLPGSTKNSGSLGVTYTLAVGDADLIGNWTATYRGNTVTRVGFDRSFGDELPGYILNRASLTYDMDRFSITLFSDNIFDKFAVVAVDQDRSRVGVNDNVRLRFLQNVVINPRTVGLEGRVKF